MWDKSVQQLLKFVMRKQETTRPLYPFWIYDDVTPTRMECYEPALSQPFHCYAAEAL